MAKPVVQLTTRRSAVTVRSFHVLPVAGSLHRRPRSPSLADGGEVRLKYVRLGNKVTSLLAFDC